MGRGRYLSHAAHSKVVPPIGMRWAPKPNARARCMGIKLKEFGGGAVNFLRASGQCKIKGK